MAELPEINVTDRLNDLSCVFVLLHSVTGFWSRRAKTLR